MSLDIAILEDGAPTRTRTADLLITNQLLYQLSYRGTLGCFDAINIIQSESSRGIFTIVSID